MLFVLAGVPATTANVVGYAMAALLLWQGAAYWYLKYRQLSAGRSRPSAIPVFAAIQRVNVIVLAVGLVAILVELWQRPGVGTWPGAAFGVLAVAEHINYFHVQLSYQSRSDLRRLVRTRRLHASHLSTDLRRRR